MTQVDTLAVARQGLLEGYRTAGTTTWVTAHGTSMEPLIPAGSRLLVEFGRRPYRIGAVILFRRDDRVLAHRLVARRSTSSGPVLLAKGDNEAFLDPALAEENVLGIVREVVRPDGRTATLALARRRGALLARVSHWSGRVAGFGARTIRRSPLPTSMRRATLGTLLALSRVPTRLTTALMPRLDRGRSAGRR
jgi:hypothetical protein